MKRRVKPAPRTVIVQVRPVAEATHPWWRKESGEWAWASLDPFDPPGWSAGLDDDYAIDAIELWKDLKLTIYEYVRMMSEQWLEEHGPDDGPGEDDETPAGCEWEFRMVEDLGDFLSGSAAAARTGAP